MFGRFNAFCICKMMIASCVCALEIDDLRRVRGESLRNFETTEFVAFDNQHHRNGGRNSRYVDGPNSM